MRVLHIIPSMAPSYGGPATALPGIAKGLLDAGVSVDVATIINPGEQADPAQAVSDEAHGFRRFVFARTTRPYRISLPLGRWLDERVREYALVHVHAVFTYSSRAGCRSAFSNAVPYIVRPLGILNRWGMEQRRPLAKKFFFKFIEKPLLDAAAGMHYTSETEAEEAARLSIRAPARIVPLGIDLGPFERLPGREIFVSRFFPDSHAGGPVILFLSRLDPKKGIDLLLDAFQSMLSSHPRARLVIAGDGDAAFVRSLKERAAQLGLGGSVVWPGFLAGEMKLAALAAADVFCLPSHSENFGMALLEAMAAGKACVSSDQVALGVEAARSSAVKLVTRDAASIAKALEDVMASADRRSQLGATARTYAREHHGIAAVGTRLAAWYEEIVGAKR